MVGIERTREKALRREDREIKFPGHLSRIQNDLQCDSKHPCKSMNGKGLRWMQLYSVGDWIMKIFIVIVCGFFEERFKQTKKYISCPFNPILGDSWRFGGRLVFGEGIKWGCDILNSAFWGTDFCNFGKTKPHRQSGNLSLKLHCWPLWRLTRNVEEHSEEGEDIRTDNFHGLLQLRFGNRATERI